MSVVQTPGLHNSLGTFSYSRRGAQPEKQAPSTQRADVTSPPLEFCLVSFSLQLG